LGLNHYRSEAFACSCCGFLTLAEPSGSSEVCPVCRWEENIVQNADEDYAGGANSMSLREAQSKFAELGVCELSQIRFARPPVVYEVRSSLKDPRAKIEEIQQRQAAARSKLGRLPG